MANFAPIQCTYINLNKNESSDKLLISVNYSNIKNDKNCIMYGEILLETTIAAN